MNSHDVNLLNDCELPLEQVEITTLLKSRSSRNPDYKIENEALKRLSQTLLDPKAPVLQELTDLILKVCGADSAGISIAETEGDQELFRWHAISGMLAPFAGGTLPRDLSPCGLVATRKQTVLLEKPIRYWPHMAMLGIPLYEVLLTPFFEAGKIAGLLWAVSHREGKKFDREDERLLRSLSDMAALAVNTGARFHRLESEQSKIIGERDSIIGQQNWLNQAIDQIPKPVFFLNIDAQTMWSSNKAAREMLGIRYENELGTAMAAGKFSVSTIDGHVLSTDELPSRRTFRGETISGEEFILKTFSGRFHIKVFAEQIPAAHGQPRGAVIIFQDITQLKAAEEELLRTKAELNEAIEIAQIGSWSIDVATNKLSVTPILMKQFGLDPKTFSGSLQDALDQIDERDRDKVTSAIRRAISDHTPYQIEYRVNQRDGNLRWIDAKGEVLRDEEGHALRFAGTTVDITDFVRAREATERAREAAEIANQTKSQFLANMSHEIRTPLGAIMGFSELARHPEVSREDINSYLSIIDRNSTQLLRIIDDILDLAKVEAGRIELEMMEISLTDFIADFSALLGFRAREKGIGFSVKALTALPSHITTDPTRLRQILNNAVGNSIKFTTKGSVSLALSYHEGILELRITDTGRGISREQAAGLFRAFAQADPSTTRKFGGTGLGLVLTKRLCELMGGDYVLTESAVDQGSIFTASIRVELPTGARLLSRAEIQFENFEAPDRSTTHGLLDGRHILLVEDSPDNQTLIRMILERQGARLDVVGDGYAGVEKALAGNYDLVVMDIQMPMMDGHEAMRALRLKSYPKPVIALTAHAMKEEEVRAQASGFSGFLTKPIQRQALINMINDLTKA